MKGKTATQDHHGAQKDLDFQQKQKERDTLAALMAVRSSAQLVKACQSRNVF
jgi:hypothetical protein